MASGAVRSTDQIALADEYEAGLRYTRRLSSRATVELVALRQGSDFRLDSTRTAPDGATALAYAAYRDNLEAARALLDAGADIDAREARVTELLEQVGLLPQQPITPEGISVRGLDNARILA